MQSIDESVKQIVEALKALEWTPSPPTVFTVPTDKTNNPFKIELTVAGMEPIYHMGRPKGEKWSMVLTLDIKAGLAALATISKCMLDIVDLLIGNNGSNGSRGGHAQATDVGKFEPISIPSNLGATYKLKFDIRLR
jgi:hypothetical protein